MTKIGKTIRSKPMHLSDDDVKFMFKKFGFFDSIWNQYNQGIANQFNAVNIQGKKNCY